MKAFPVFHRLEISNYGLYPGKSIDNSGLKIDFHPGLTLVLGANGLGKTTLINIIFRVLTGPYDIGKLEPGQELGNRKIEAKNPIANLRSIFAKRVSDGADNATAKLSFSLGPRQFHVTRSLNSLRLENTTVDGEQITSEINFQEEVINASGLSSFGDFILSLRYLLFYFEDRRALVWDQTAQRALLRALFLPPEEATTMYRKERKILQLDSRMRNLRAALHKRIKEAEEDASKIDTKEPLVAQLEALEALHSTQRDQLDELTDEIQSIDIDRQATKLDLLKVRQKREACFRTLEHAKLVAMESRFPGEAETARYIIANIMSDNSCLVCGNEAPHAAERLEQLLDNNQCVVCETDLGQTEKVANSHQVADKRVSRAKQDLESASKELIQPR